MGFIIYIVITNKTRIISITNMEAIKTNLKPLIHQIPKPVHDFGISLLGSDVCYKELVWDLNLAHIDCLKLAVSKGLGVAIVGVSAIVKLPQLITILRAQSASGISFTSYVLETAAYLITLAYNARQGNPFSTYGENAFIAAQNVAIAALVLHFTNKSAGAAAFVALVAGGVYALFNEGLIDSKNMVVLQGAAGILGVASKIPQIYTIWSEGSTGQLSAFAVSLSLLIKKEITDETRYSTFCLAH
jgi:mannose-P-dolichol utilization defect protein 1